MTTAAKPKHQICVADDREHLVVVTGFGPFVGHENVNASWEAVRLLPDEIKEAGRTFQLKKMEIPVEYAAVDEAVDEIWSLRPTLVIHCGVHGHASCVLVEKLAYNNSFHKQDYAGNHLADGKACLKNCPVKKSAIFCKLNVNKIVEVVANECGCTPDHNMAKQSGKVLGDTLKVAKVSKDVGNYLCGYIYLKSLDRDCNRTLFVHVPPLDNPFSAEKLGEVVMKITAECLRQVVEMQQASAAK